MTSTKVISRGTCDFCGEELPMSKLTQFNCDYLCEDCKPEVETVEPGLCGACNGSGEGQYDGTRCSYCHGSGVEK